MRRMENDLLFFHELIGNCSVEKDSKTYTISPKFGKGTMQSFNTRSSVLKLFIAMFISQLQFKRISSVEIVLLKSPIAFMGE